MGFLTRVLVVAVSLSIAVIIKNYSQISRALDAPDFDLKEYWGPGSASAYKEDVAVKPFDITTPHEVIDDLKALLGRPLKLHKPLEGIGFQYGFNSEYLKKVVKYWRDSYLQKWDERETYLKQFPHFTTQIQGLRLHFIHVKPKKAEGKNVLPLLLLHGWPGSVREFYEFIPLLTQPNPKSDYVFEVIAPSLPGYGWSEASSKVNFGPAQMSIVLRNLMLRLGHQKFVIQGGDWGSLIGSNLAALFPENVLAYHSNMCTSNHPMSQMKFFITRMLPGWFFKKDTADFYPSLGQIFSKIMEEMGYFHLQATKPDTIGTALLNNPVGLATYILEKFSVWTNTGYKALPDGGLSKRYTLEALLDNVMIYYVTNSITTSQRLYAEAFSIAQTSLQMDRVPVKVPSGCARFFHDLMHSTDCELKNKFVNLVHSSYHRDGGHFAAMEVPQKLYEDFTEFIDKAFKIPLHT